MAILVGTTAELLDYLESRFENLEKAKPLTADARYAREQLDGAIVLLIDHLRATPELLGAYRRARGR